MEDSISNHENFLEQIASFDPLSNPNDFKNIGLDNNQKNFGPKPDLDFFSDNTSEISNNLSNSTSYLSPIASKETKPLSDGSEKIKSVDNNKNAFYSVESHYHESPTRVSLSDLSTSDRNVLSASHSNVTENLTASLSPIDSKKFIQKNFKDQSLNHSFNSYRFNKSTNISSSIGSIQNDNYCTNKKLIITSKNKKFDIKRYIKRSEYNSTGGTAADCAPTLRRRSFQTMKPKYNSVTREFDSGRFHITLSSHSEVSQSENSSCEENEKEKEKKKDKNASSDQKKNRKVKRFNISYIKNTSNESNSNHLNEYDQNNIQLKHACSDRTVISSDNSENKLLDINSDDDDDIFYKMQLSSMPVLHRHKKKGCNSSNKPSKNINNNNTNQFSNNNECNMSDISTKNHNPNTNSTINDMNVMSPPKSTPFNPTILNIDMDSTLTSNSLSAKLGSQNENEPKGQPDNLDDLISIF